MEAVGNTEQGRVTLFEFLTAMAFYYFREQEVGAQVIEVGLGGRLDSTNVVQPLACGITSLGLDHTEVLGATLDKIAEEKAGIIKKGVPVVSAPQSIEALRVLQETCRRQESKLVLAGEDIRWEHESSSLDGQVFTVDTGRGRYRLRVPLLGEHQLENATVAVGIIEALVDGGMEIDAGAIEEGFQSVDWPCRLEVLRRNPLLMADGAHNPHSAARLVEAVKSLFPDRRVLLVVGISRNKDLEGLIEVLSLLSPAEVVATRSRHPRATQPDRLAHEFRLHVGRVRVGRLRVRGFGRGAEYGRRRETWYWSQGRFSWLPKPGSAPGASPRRHTPSSTRKPRQPHIAYEYARGIPLASEAGTPRLLQATERHYFEEKIAMSDNRVRVVVTGMGAVTPLGSTVEQFWEGLVAGRSGVGPITLCDTSRVSNPHCRGGHGL